MAFDAFLKVDNIQGESQDSKFTNQIELSSFSWGAEQTTNVGGGGLGAGKAKLSDLSVMKNVDKASPKLFNALCTGLHIASVVLSLRKAGGGTAGGYVFLTYTLTNAIVTDLKVSGSSEIPMESVSFAYQKVVVEYFQQQTSGAVASTGSQGWDVVTNKAS